jgi:[ribosomal protein S18]-alanine N-acetyltransferase
MEIKQRPQGQHIFLELWDNNELLGTLDYIPVPPEIQIIDLIVHEQYRQQGYGTKLLQELLYLARTSGCSKIFLEVRVSNLAGRNLYNKFDFVETGQRKDYYRDPVETAVLMTRSIA